ncbi:glycosidase [archaeon]|nr:MAG: glycosidase [archaeon]
MKENRMKELLVRSAHNPLICASDMPYQANAVFNVGSADLGDQVLLLLRVESRSGRSHLTVARSRDGVTDWQIEKEPLSPGGDRAYEEYGAQDCRITRVDELGAWVLDYTAYSQYGPAVAVATTRDFVKVEPLGVAFPPSNKDAAIFPRRINGRYAMLHRPLAQDGNIWIAYSPDLVHWGENNVVLPLHPGPWWDGSRVGTGIPPIETEYGWLILYHGIKNMPSGPIYRVGAALLDLDEPSRLIAHTRHWLFGPEEPYERTGDVPNVVFPCGGFVRGEDLWVYYGAADSSICLAKGNVNDIIDAVRADPVEAH